MVLRLPDSILDVCNRRITIGSGSGSFGGSLELSWIFLIDFHTDRAPCVFSFAQKSIPVWNNQVYHLAQDSSLFQGVSGRFGQKTPGQHLGQ